MRRVLLLSFALLASGCMGGGADSGASSNATNQTSATPSATLGANATQAFPIGEVFTETLWFSPDHSLQFHAANASPPAGKVAESIHGRDFYGSFVQGLTLKPWASPPARAAAETAGDIPITLSFVSDQPAANSMKPSGLSAVGGWIGTAERFAVFFQVENAPDTLEAGKVYTVKAVAKMPKAGFFLRQGESWGINAYLGYDTPGTISWVTGGEQGTRFDIPHKHFDLVAPRETVIAQKDGKLGPNPGTSTATDPAPVDFALTLPADAKYLVVEVKGTGSGGHFDVDLDVRSGSESLGSGGGPYPHEFVVLGPAALAGARELTAHVAGAGAGGTFTLKATAYSP